MNEPKRRGRPPKASIEGADVPTVIDPPPTPPAKGGALFAIETLGEVIFFVTEEARDACLRAQAYALRVWSGQSITVPRNERIKRVTAALEGQGLSMEGVVLP